MKTIDRITEVLQASDLFWLLPNLRQDFVVWNNLNDPTFYEKFAQAKAEGYVYTPADFSPARLALQALGQACSETIDPQNLLDSLDPQLLQTAMRSFSDQTILKTYPQDLASAGLIGLAAASRFRSMNSWKELISTLACTDPQIWAAPIVCLYGYIEKQNGLLTALVQPGCDPSRIKLAVHAVLSNPLPFEEQIATLLELCVGPYGDLLPPADRLTLVGELKEQRPQLAAAFCSHWLETHPSYSPDGNQDHHAIVRDIDRLSEILFEIALIKIAGASDLPADLIAAEKSLTHTLNARLANEILSNTSKELAGTIVIPGSATISDNAIHISDFSLPLGTSSASQAELALTLSNQGLIEQASNLLPTASEPLPDDVNILYAIARLSFEGGNLERSEKAASRLVELLNQDASIGGIPVWGEYLSQINLGKLLHNLQKPAEAVCVLEFALRTCPNDTEILNLLAQSYISCHQDQLASEAFHTLVSLHPTHIEYRRAFAASLENFGEWQSSLTQRSVILAAHQSNPKSTPIGDLYAYVHCALKADQPRLALKVCQDILVDDQDDTQALIYTGQAHLQMNDVDQGLGFLVRATEASHQLPEAWLALADAQKKIYPVSTVIETLKNGALAIPECSQIYFTLGDLYLQDNAPTLALPNLRSAVELSPDDPKILVSYGEALRSLGHQDEARNALAKAYALEPKFPGLAHLYSRILLDSGDLEQAISPLELLINNKSVRDPAVFLDYARCVLTLNKRGSTACSPMKALIALNEVMLIDPDHAEAKALTAEALAASGENELAFQAYSEALDTPLNMDKDWRERLSYGFGCIANAIGKYDIAIAALQEASQANPINPAIFMVLSDAYLSANLPEDALRSARSVLVIDGENPDQLAWFAQHTVQIMRTQPLESSNSAVGISKQLPSEALTALNKAIQLAPTRTDLLIQLGDLLTILGAKDEARAIFVSIASFDFATVVDLQGAAEYLSRNGDHSSAIACLEKGISIDQAASGQHVTSLYSDLAREYVRNNDHTSAINILDQAIVIIPSDPSLLSLKVDILLGLGQCIDALDCIEKSISKNTGHTANVDLLILASRINRSIGDFSAAVNYAQLCIAAANQPISNKNSIKLNIRQLTQIAELYRSLLQPNAAYQILQDAERPIPLNLAVEPEYLDYLYLHTELALETDEPFMSEIEDVQIESSHPSFSRLMAIKSRMMNLAGNMKEAEQLYQIAAHSLGRASDTANLPGWEAPFIKYQNTLSVIEAALDLGLWDQAVDLIQPIFESRSSEPLSHLKYAEAIIRRAEFGHLCDIFEVTQHKPSSNSLSSECLNQSVKYLEQAQIILGSYQGEQIVPEYALSNDQIYRWRARAEIIAERESEMSPDDFEVLAHQRSGEDLAALVNHLHHLAVLDPDSDSFNRIIKIARSALKNPAVILQVALALNETNPADTLKALQSVLQQNPLFKHPTIAFCNILLARIGLKLGDYVAARDAVESALEFWPEEPYWHSLAAQIYLKTSDINRAGAHLSTASQLDPKNISYHLDLGKLYLDSAHEDVRVLHQALECFENAVALDQNEVSALLDLATTQCLLHDLDNANDNARKALLLAPNRADIYQLLSEIAICNEDFQGSYEYANKAILANPKDIQSTVTLVKSLSALGRHQEALARLDSAITGAQQSRLLSLERVNILRKKDGPRAALTELSSLTKVYPDDFTILNALSKLYLEVGEFEHAVSAAQEALKTCTEQSSRNEQANLHLMIGQILRQCGQLDQSIQHLNEAIQLAPDRLEPYLELGLARKERREYQQALQIFERATIIAPDDPRAPYQAGLALKESKDYKSSETMLRRAVSLAPNDLTIRRQLAAVVALNLVHNPRAGRS